MAFASEREALEALLEIQQSMGWVIKVYTKDDVEKVIQAELTDAQWDELTNDPRWLKVSRMNPDDAGAVRDVVEDVLRLRLRSVA